MLIPVAITILISCIATSFVILDLALDYIIKIVKRIINLFKSNGNK